MNTTRIEGLDEAPRAPGITPDKTRGDPQWEVALGV